MQEIRYKQHLQNIPNTPIGCYYCCSANRGHAAVNTYYERKGRSGVGSFFLVALIVSEVLEFLVDPNVPPKVGSA